VSRLPGVTADALVASALYPSKPSHILQIQKPSALPDMEDHTGVRELKEEILNNSAILHRKFGSTNAETHLEEDPEISLIKQLREEGKKWATIANVLNQMHHPCLQSLRTQHNNHCFPEQRNRL
jgi:hypothetical protein